ncbi:glycosyltransferase family 39 protein [Motilibacter peucedani]|uniref:glycosyltransferase family 39 protein n=1 Tax=Motilibacter peucedani TaxID=598650 RepID=UPI0015FF2E17|nr:glycosyltransferase family 39 protein [Motilibacter peucedani]
MGQASRRPVAPAVGATALAVFVVLLAVAGRYGYHRDELYFLQAGRHLAWGYPDQPPLVPALARLASWIDADSLTVLRVPSALCAAAVVVVAALTARDLGARTSGQVLAACAAALDGTALGTGHLLSTATTNLLGWTVVTWLVVRLVKGAGLATWLALGAAAGISMLAHPLAAVLLVGCAASVLAVGPRSLLAPPGPVLAAGVAAVLALPYVVWQARHGFPQLDVASSVSGGGSTSSEPRALFLPLQVLQTGPFLAPVWIAGLVALWRDRSLRFLAVTYALLAAAFLVLGGKPYYLSGMYPLLFAAGAQPLLDAVRRRWVVPALLVLSLPVVYLTLPVVPFGAAGVPLAVNPDAAETIGWPGYVREVAEAYHAAPPGTVVLTQNYGEAGAVDRYGAALGLPRAYSGHNGYWYWGSPPESTSSVLAVGFDAPTLQRWFGTVRQVGELHNRWDVDGEEQGKPLWVCSSPREDWPSLWPQMARLA